MRDLIKMVVVLTAICSGAALILSYTKDATEERRKTQILTFVKGPSIKAVLSDSNNNPLYDNDPIKDFKVLEMGKDEKGKTIQKEIFPAFKNGKLVAMAFDTRDDKGFGGSIDVMVGMDLDGNLTGLSVMTHSETPGLGARIEEPEFTNQFRGLTQDDIDLSTNGGKIDAISGATISSNAVVRALKKAVEIFPQVKKEVS